jgi:hypothetical protein
MEVSQENMTTLYNVPPKYQDQAFLNLWIRLIQIMMDISQLMILYLLAIESSFTLIIK